MFKEFYNLKQRCLFTIHDPVGVIFKPTVKIQSFKQT